MQIANLSCFQLFYRIYNVELVEEKRLIGDLVEPHAISCGGWLFNLPSLPLMMPVSKHIYSTYVSNAGAPILEFC